MDHRISQYLLQLRRHHPFLATLSMMASYTFDADVEQVSANGIDVRINPDYFQQLANDQANGLLLHATLHNALLHASRRGARQNKIWNIAADIVVNQIIAEAGVFKAPPDTAIEPRYAGLSVEQVYEKLCTLSRDLAQSQDGEAQSQHQPSRPAGQLGEPATGDSPENALLAQLYPAIFDLAGAANQQNDPQAQRNQKALENHWKASFRQAETVQRLHHKSRGRIPAGLIREIDALYQPELDWKTLLWRFVSRTPCDFNGFDRRFVHQKLYLEQLESESLNLAVAIDTSASVEKQELSQFISEISAILNAYPFIKAKLFFVDAAVHGPYSLDQTVRLPVIRGGGGTDFIELLQTVERNRKAFEDLLCIYMTDGLGNFPRQAPEFPVLWVVSNGGLDSDAFPFGEVARLSSDSL